MLMEMSYLNGINLCFANGIMLNNTNGNMLTWLYYIKIFYWETKSVTKLVISYQIDIL